MAPGDVQGAPCDITSSPAPGNFPNASAAADNASPPSPSKTATRTPPPPVYADTLKSTDGNTTSGHATGKQEGRNVTFEEMLTAIEAGKPYRLSGSGLTMFGETIAITDDEFEEVWALLDKVEGNDFMVSLP